MGSARFNDLRRGLPRISPTILAKRLKTLEDKGLIVKEWEDNGVNSKYHLTKSCEELSAVIKMIGVWGRRWVHTKFTEDELDVGLLMWDIRRGINVDHFSKQRTVIQFDFSDLQIDESSRWWMIVSNQDVDVCNDDPGYEVDLAIDTDLVTMTKVWMGDINVDHAMSTGELLAYGPFKYVSTMSKWLGQSLFADVKNAGNQLQR